MQLLSDDLAVKSAASPSLSGNNAPQGAMANSEADRKQKKREYQKKYQRQYRIDNHDKLLAAYKKWRAENPARQKELTRRWLLENRDRKYPERKNAWYKTHLEKARQYRERRRELLASNPELKQRALELCRLRTQTPEARAKAVASQKRRMMTDPQYRIYQTLLKRVWEYLGPRSGRKGTVQLLGCSIAEFKSYIESRWAPGMSWDNHGRTLGCWQMDHKRPCASFDLTDPKQADECFHFTNVHPLWREENTRKGSLYNGRRWMRKSKALCDTS